MRDRLHGCSWVGAALFLYAGCSSVGLGDDGDTGDGGAASGHDLAHAPAGCMLDGGLGGTPSLQTVTMHIINTLDTDRFVVAGGAACTPFSVAPQGGPEMALELGYVCGCDCPAPPIEHASQLHRIAPGGAMDLTWDARRVITCAHSIDCSGPGPARTITAYTTDHTAVPSGIYEIVIGVESVLPPSCQLMSGDDFTCSPGNGMGKGAMFQTRCDADQTYRQDLLLPASGDISADFVLQ